MRFGPCSNHMRPECHVDPSSVEAVLPARGAQAARSGRAGTATVVSRGDTASMTSWSRGSSPLAKGGERDTVTGCGRPVTASPRARRQQHGSRGERLPRQAVTAADRGKGNSRPPTVTPCMDGSPGPEGDQAQRRPADRLVRRQGTARPQQQAHQPGHRTPARVQTLGRTASAHRTSCGTSFSARSRPLGSTMQLATHVSLHSASAQGHRKAISPVGRTRPCTPYWRRRGRGSTNGDTRMPRRRQRPGRSSALAGSCAER